MKRIHRSYGAKINHTNTELRQKCTDYTGPKFYNYSVNIDFEICKYKIQKMQNIMKT